MTSGQAVSLATLLRAGLSDPADYVAAESLLSTAVRFTHAGINSELSELKPYKFDIYSEPGILVEVLLTSPGHDSGRALRGFVIDLQDRIVAIHLDMEVPRSLRRRGFATNYNNHLIDWYKTESVHRVELETIFVGGYAWAAAGWDFAVDQDRDSALSRRRQVVAAENEAAELFLSAAVSTKARLRRTIHNRARRLEGQAGDAGHLLGDRRASAQAISQAGRLFQLDDSWVGYRAMFDSMWTGVRLI
jgi:hypothetical protein